MENSAEYTAAIEAHNVALRVYQVAVTEYRALRMNDADFLAARKVKAAADAVFDEAFAKESERAVPDNDSSEVENTLDGQLVLF